MSEPLLSVKDCAAALGLTTRGVRHRIQSGRLPAVRVPGKFGPEWRVDPAQLREYHGVPAPFPPEAGSEGPSTEPPGGALHRLHEQIGGLQGAVADLGRRLEGGATPAAGDESPHQESRAAIAAIVRHLSELEQRVAEESRQRRREYQELHGGLQALLAAAQAGLAAETEDPASASQAEERSLGARARTWLGRPRR